MVHQRLHKKLQEIGEFAEKDADHIPVMY